jgi:hypothetical protein
MPLIKKSHGSIWRVWSGDRRVAAKEHKKRVDISVAINVRINKLPGTGYSKSRS